MPRLPLQISAFALATALSAVAGATPPDKRDACRVAFSDGPEMVKDGRLLEASSKLRVCAADPCPDSMRAMCAEDLRRLEERIPSVVFSAKDASDHDVVVVRVVEGGRILAPKLDGRSVAIDPGAHTFRFEGESGATEVQALVREGEKARAIVAQMPAPTGPAMPERPLPERREETRPIPWTVFVAGGVTVLATASYAYFGARGLSERSDLDDCKGHCAHDSVQRVRTSFTIADISFATAAVGLVATFVLYMTRPTVSRDGVGIAPWLVHAF